MRDYCGSLTTPQVIDPTDQQMAISDAQVNTVPAQLIDSAVFSQFGLDTPMKVMKGYAVPKELDQSHAQNI